MTVSNRYARDTEQQAFERLESRELESAFVPSRGSSLELEPSSPPSAGPPASREHRRDWPSLQAARRAAIDRFEIDYVRNLLQQTAGNVTRAAALADVSRQVIHKLIARHRL